MSPTGNETARAVLMGVGTLVVGISASMAVFALLDVNWIFLAGPVIGVALAAYAAYRTARDVPPG